MTQEEIVHMPKVRKLHRIYTEEEKKAAEAAAAAKRKAEQEKIIQEAKKKEEEEKLHISRLEAITRRRSRRVASRLETIQEETVYVPTIIQEEIVHMPTIQPRVGFILPVSPKNRLQALQLHKQAIPSYREAYFPNLLY